MALIGGSLAISKDLIPLADGTDEPSSRTSGTAGDQETNKDQPQGDDNPSNRNNQNHLVEAM